MTARDFGGLLEAGALNAVLAFIQSYGASLHKDALRSAMGVVSRLCTKIEPSDGSLCHIVESLTALLKHTDGQVRARCLFLFFVSFTFASSHDKAAISLWAQIKSDRKYNNILTLDYDLLRFSFDRFFWNHLVTWMKILFENDHS